MFGELLTQPDLFGFGLNLRLHGCEQVLVDPAGDAPTTLVARALRLEATLAAGSRVAVVADLALLLDGREAIGQGLAGRAPVVVLIGVVAEVFFGEQAALAVGGGVRFGDVRGDVFLKTGLHFLPIVVPLVGDHIHLVHAQSLLGPLRHVELTRLSGHLYAYPKGVHDAANEITLSRRIPQANRRACAIRSKPIRTGKAI